MLGVESDIVTLIPLLVILGVGGVAKTLLFGDKAPLFGELDLTGLRRKSYQLVVGGLCLLTGQQGQADDRVLLDPDKAGSLEDVASSGQVLQDDQSFIIRDRKLKRGLLVNSDKRSLHAWQ